ncbi:MAG TPA: DUF4388 domain-containing protein [Thermoanaerobaculia bacterium]|nr:DUF4388 domain-containing protein [Thermoanaerobaculia bacterium]
MTSEKQAFRGDLSLVQFADVLTFVSMVRRTGKLVVGQGDLERTIYWNRGEIVFATANSTEHSLGHFLLRNGKITEQQYEESRSRLTSGTRHGKVLVQMGAISPKDLWWGVKNQVLEIIYSVFGWDEGEFTFWESDEQIRERILLSLNTSSIIMEGIRRLDEGAMIRERITSFDTVYATIPGADAQLPSLDLDEHEIVLFHLIDGRRSIRDLIRSSELTEFEALRILYQLVSARLIEEVRDERRKEPVFLDVEDSPELLRIISTYNDMFGHLFEVLAGSVGEDRAREVFMITLQNAESNELWNGVFFDQFGRFDENMLVANVSELPFEQRKAVLEDGLNTLLSIHLFEVSQNLDDAAKVDVFRFISDQKAQLERVGAES